MKTVKMSIQNFKGIENLEIYADGENVSVIGENGTGKTTVADAFIWCLTGKLLDGTTGDKNILPIGKNNVKPKVKLTFATGKREFGVGRELSAKFEGDTLTGTTTKYLCDGVNATKKQFDVFIGEVVPFDALPYLIQPKNFCAAHWTAQRKLLLQMCGSFDGIIDKEKFSEIRDEIKLHGVEFLQTSLKQSIKENSDKLKAIPITIKALTEEGKPSESASDLQAEISRYEDERQEIDKAIFNLEYSPADKTKILAERISLKQSEIYGIQRKIDEFDGALEELRGEFRKIAKEKICPTCGQDLPENLIKAKKNYINMTGQDVKGQRTEKAAELEKLNGELAELKKQFDENKPADNSAKIVELKEKRRAIQTLLEAARQKLFNVQQYDKNQNRIEQLKKAETELSKTIADYERKMALTKQFICERVETVEDSINEKFSIVKWKLFDVVMTTGEIKECCEAMIDGVPYSTLNKGGKLTAALDILKTLQEFYKVEMPLFIDDCESYTSNSFIEIPNQIFKLTVSEGVKKLTVKVENPEEKPVEKYENVNVTAKAA